MRDEDEQVIVTLKSLKPSASQANAVAAAFEAGRRSGRQAAVRWRFASGVLSVAFVVALSSPLFRSRPVESERPSFAVEPDLVAFATSMPNSSATTELPAVFLMNRRAIEQGIDALPHRPAKPNSSAPALLPLEGERVLDRGDL